MQTARPTTTMYLIAVAPAAIVLATTIGTLSTLGVSMGLAAMILWLVIYRGICVYERLHKPTRFYTVHLEGRCNRAPVGRIAGLLLVGTQGGAYYTTIESFVTHRYGMKSHGVRYCVECQDNITSMELMAHTTI